MSNVKIFAVQDGKADGQTDGKKTPPNVQRCVDSRVILKDKNHTRM